VRHVDALTKILAVQAVIAFVLLEAASGDGIRATM
jgi:hypothetical protein